MVFRHEMQTAGRTDEHLTRVSHARIVITGLSNLLGRVSNHRTSAMKGATMSHSALHYLFVRQLRSPWTPTFLAGRTSAKVSSQSAGRRVSGRRALPIGATGK